MAPTSVEEWPNQTLFTRSQAAKVLGVGLTTLDSTIPSSELPRIRINRRVLFHRNDLAKYIASRRCYGGEA